MLQDKNLFPTSDDLSNEKALEFVPQMLRFFLQNIFTGENNGTRIAFIGQSIMQSCRPRSLVCPTSVRADGAISQHFPEQVGG